MLVPESPQLLFSFYANSPFVIHLDTLGIVVGPIHALVWSFINLLRDSCSWLAAALKNVVSSFFKSSTIHRDLGLWSSNTLHSLSSPLLAIFISIHQYFKLACIIKCKVKKINHWTSYPKLLMNALITDKQILLCNTILTNDVSNYIY